MIQLPTLEKHGVSAQPSSVQALVQALVLVTSCVSPPWHTDTEEEPSLYHIPLPCLLYISSQANTSSSNHCQKQQQLWVNTTTSNNEVFKNKTRSSSDDDNYNEAMDMKVVALKTKDVPTKRHGDPNHHRSATASSSNHDANNESMN
eukprot:2234148-Ditylum_brightwellii.AAC.1